MDSYTLILTRGTHVIERETGETILRAVAERDTMVRVDIDVLCDGFVRRNVELMVAHIIALIPNDEAACDAIPCAGNVTPLRTLAHR